MKKTLLQIFVLTIALSASDINIYPSLPIGFGANLNEQNNNFHFQIKGGPAFRFNRLGRTDFLIQPQVGFINYDHRFSTGAKFNFLVKDIYTLGVGYDFIGEHLSDQRYSFQAGILSSVVFEIAYSSREINQWELVFIFDPFLVWPIMP